MAGASFFHAPPIPRWRALLSRSPMRPARFAILLDILIDIFAAAQLLLDKFDLGDVLQALGHSPVRRQTNATHDFSATPCSITSLAGEGIMALNDKPAAPSAVTFECSAITTSRQRSQAGLLRAAIPGSKKICHTLVQPPCSAVASSVSSQPRNVGILRQRVAPHSIIRSVQHVTASISTPSACS